MNKISKRNNMNKSALDNSKSRAPRSIENRATSQSMYYNKKSSIITSESGRMTDLAKRNQTRISNIKKNKGKQLEEEIKNFKVIEDMFLKKEKISKMNDNIRKLNSQKSNKKKRTMKKNFTVKLPHQIKIDKPKLSSTSKGNFLQQFKQIRKEIQDEIKKEDLKFKSRVATA